MSHFFARPQKLGTPKFNQEAHTSPFNFPLLSGEQLAELIKSQVLYQLS